MRHRRCARQRRDAAPRVDPDKVPGHGRAKPARRACFTPRAPATFADARHASWSGRSAGGGGRWRREARLRAARCSRRSRRGTTCSTTSSASTSTGAGGARRSRRSAWERGADGHLSRPVRRHARRRAPSCAAARASRVASSAPTSPSRCCVPGAGKAPPNGRGARRRRRARAAAAGRSVVGRDRGVRHSQRRRSRRGAPRGATACSSRARDS